MKLNFILKSRDGKLITNKTISDSDYSPEIEDVIDFTEHLDEKDINKSIKTYQVGKIIYRLIGDNIETFIECYPLDINYVDRLLQSGQ